MAILGKGASLNYAAATNETSATNFTALSSVEEIGFPALKAGPKVDTTHLGTTGDYRTSIAGAFKELTEFDAKVQFAASDYSTLSGIVGVVKTWKIIFPTSTAATNCASASFPGHVDEIAGDTIVSDNKVINTVKIVIDGALTFSAGS
jgi:hypothetical protein